MAIKLKSTFESEILFFYFLAISSLACGIYAVLFLKLWSYIQVNFWCRSVALNRPQMLAKAARHPSLADFGPAAAAANNATLRKSIILFICKSGFSKLFYLLIPRGVFICESGFSDFSFRFYFLIFFLFMNLDSPYFYVFFNSGSLYFYLRIRIF